MVSMYDLDDFNIKRENLGIILYIYSTILVYLVVVMSTNSNILATIITLSSIFTLVIFRTYNPKNKIKPKLKA